jgi:hypothetical protein
LADFYHRRIRPRDELAALTAAAAAAKDDPHVPATAQRGWRAFERMACARQEALPEPVAEPVFRAWVARYPKEPAAWRKLIEYLAAAKQFAAAEAEIARYGRTFHDAFEPVKMRADLEMRRGNRPSPPWRSTIARFSRSGRRIMRRAISSCWRSTGNSGNLPDGRARRSPRIPPTWTPPRGSSTIFGRRTISPPRAAHCSNTASPRNPAAAMDSR